MTGVARAGIVDRISISLEQLSDVSITSPTSGQTITWNGTEWVNGSGGGSGTVTGPTSSVNNDLVVFNGTTGKIIADSGIAASNVALLNANNTFTGTTNTFNGDINSGGAVNTFNLNLIVNASAGTNYPQFQVLDGSGSLGFAVWNDQVGIGGVYPPLYALDIYDFDATGTDIGNSTTGLWYISNAGVGTFQSINGNEFSVSVNQSASSSIFYFSGSLYTSATGSTNWPAFYYNAPSSGTPSFSIHGTAFGANAGLSFTGNYLDFRTTSGSVFSVNYTGNILASGSTITMGAASFSSGSFSGNVGVNGASASNNGITVPTTNNNTLNTKAVTNGSGGLYIDSATVAFNVGNNGFPLAMDGGYGPLGTGSASAIGIYVAGITAIHWCSSQTATGLSNTSVSDTTLCRISAGVVGVGTGGKGSTATSGSSMYNGTLAAGQANIGSLTTSASLLNVASTGTSTAFFTNTGTAGSTAGAGIVGYSDAATPAATPSGARLGFFFLGGATNTSHSLYNGGGMAAFATENWSGTAGGSQLKFQVTPNTTQTQTTALTLDQNSNALFTGNVNIGTAGTGIVIKSGSNSRIGVGTLSGGTLTIANTSVTANTLVFLTDTGTSITNVGSLTAVTTAGTGFVVTSTNPLDTSTFNWLLVELQ